MEDRHHKNIDEYIADYPLEIQAKLEAIRKTIHEAAPDAIEKISYRMPAFDYNGILVYFAVFKKHIGLFPTASGVEAFKDELTGFKTSKGTIQLPFDKPLPLELIGRIAKFRYEENKAKQQKI